MPRTLGSARWQAVDNCDLFQFPYVIRVTTLGYMSDRIQTRDSGIGMLRLGVSPGHCAEVYYPDDNWVEKGGLYERFPKDD